MEDEAEKETGVGTGRIEDGQSMNRERRGWKRGRMGGNHR